MRVFWCGVFAGFAADDIVSGQWYRACFFALLSIVFGCIAREAGRRPEQAESKP